MSGDTTSTPGHYPFIVQLTSYYLHHKLSKAISSFPPTHFLPPHQHIRAECQTRWESAPWWPVCSWLAAPIVSCECRRNTNIFCVDCQLRSKYQDMECVENCGKHAEGPQVNFEQPVRAALCHDSRNTTESVDYRYGKPSSKLHSPPMLKSLSWHTIKYVYRWIYVRSSAFVGVL